MLGLSEHPGLLAFTHPTQAPLQRGASAAAALRARTDFGKQKKGEFRGRAGGGSQACCGSTRTAFMKAAPESRPSRLRAAPARVLFPLTSPE